MEYQNNEEVENLQRQLREEENRTSLAHDDDPEAASCMPGKG